MSEQDDVGVRVRQLDNTSAPLPFEVHARVPECRKVERTLHFVFGEHQRRSNREFFTIDPDLAKAIVELVAIQQETVSDSEQGIAPSEREEIERKEEARSARLSLASLGLALGTVLTFSKDPAVTCTVAGPKTVVFKEEEQSLSAAALKAVRDMGYNRTRVEYWTFGGFKLMDLPSAG